MYLDIAERMRKHGRLRKILAEDICDEGQLYKGSIASGLSCYPEGAPTKLLWTSIYVAFILSCSPLLALWDMFLAECSHHWDI